MDEERFVDWIKELTGGPASHVGDDCAVIDEFDPPLLLTTDSMNEEIHYDDGFSAEQVGRKLVGINNSDVYAMGGRPRWALLSVSSDRSSNARERLYRGVVEALDEHGCELVGGDFSGLADEGRESLSMTVVGQAHPEGLMKRSLAEPGDRLAVTGPLGATAAVLSGDVDSRTEEEQAHLANPPYRGDTAGRLVENGVRCGIDISDGFVKDLNRILEASNAGAVVDPKAIPAHPLAKKRGTPPEEVLRWVLTGGEDFELLVTVPKSTQIDTESDLTVVGEITDRSGITWQPALPDEISLNEGGYDHFQ
jgi:thiamine-monophosphate kinase